MPPSLVRRPRLLMRAVSLRLVWKRRRHRGVQRRLLRPQWQEQKCGVRGRAQGLRILRAGGGGCACLSQRKPLCVRLRKQGSRPSRSLRSCGNGWRMRPDLQRSRGTPPFRPRTHRGRHSNRRRQPLRRAQLKQRQLRMPPRLVPRRQMLFWLQLGAGVMSCRLLQKKQKRAPRKWSSARQRLNATPRRHGGLCWRRGQPSGSRWRSCGRPPLPWQTLQTLQQRGPHTSSRRLWTGAADWRARMHRCRTSWCNWCSCRVSRAIRKRHSNSSSVTWRCCAKRWRHTRRSSRSLLCWQTLSRPRTRRRLT
mmetsp:Transcript_6589/g.17671  ORF Transcript_6589/g.17671 Transcript_6589/m.17671 type:complete len:308 (+) Transcript_6589:1892-2815(+)